jgi:hypothetical protein
LTPEGQASAWLEIREGLTAIDVMILRGLSFDKLILRQAQDERNLPAHGELVEP